MSRVLCGDVLEMLGTLESESVDCCVTSPPYWGLRDYGHRGQIGLEKTPQEFVGKMVEAFREVRRVLKPSGTCWVNLGDSYIGNATAGDPSLTCKLQGGRASQRESWKRPDKKAHGLKTKDLCGIPWRVAFALQDDGWYLRQDIVWSKPNPMPESVRDRCTKAHEYVFLLTKSGRYFYDADAIAEPSCKGDAGSSFTTGKTGEHQLGRASGRRPQTVRAESLFVENEFGAEHLAAVRACGVTDAGKALTTQDGAGKNTARQMELAREVKDALGGYYRELLIPDTRNRRSVWTIPTRGYPGAHFATFPEELPRLCILAGSPEGGVVLDPFAGSGTTGAVAEKLGRESILIELNPAYIPLIEKRLGAITRPFDFLAEGAK